jgi:hypothetical protein
MPESPRVKNQHYVPQAILRRFLAPNGHLHVYDKWERRTFSGPPRNVASETGFYDIEIGDHVFSRDPEMGRIEVANFAAVESIVTNGSLAFLTELDRWKLGYFFAMQVMRTRAARDALSQMETLTLCFLCSTLIAELRELRDNAEMNVPIPLLDALDSGTVADVPSETVVHQNSLQVAQSTRFLFSSTADFALVEEMLKTNPELAKPVFIEVK